MSEQPPADLPRTRARLPFEPRPFGSALRGGALVVYALVTLGLAALAVYMSVVAGHPLVSGYVAAPAIGALWFGLRLLMIMGSRK